MPSPMASLPSAGKTVSPATVGGVAQTREGASEPAKPSFDEMVRRPAMREDAPALKPAPRRDEGQETALPPAHTAKRSPDKAAHATDDQDTRETPVSTLMLPDLPVPTRVALPSDPGVAMVPTDPLGNPLLGDPLLGGALPAEAPSSPDAPSAGSRVLLPTSPASTLPAQANAGVDNPGVPDLQNAATATATTADATATALPTATATMDNLAKAPLQNLLSFTAHLATGQAGAAIPEVINLGRDIIDALRNDDAETTTSPTGTLLAGVGASNAPLGLARTETVNAMEAPSADLHGGHFDEDVADAVRWMADQKIGHAHIKVTPNDLGTVEIRLRLEGDRVHADFSSAQADVRQALENSLPKLRDMLGQHGFQLAHADVGQQHAPPSQGGTAPHGEGAADTSDAGPETPRTVRMTARGLVDAYA
ncbi:flagellar hook-length control protein FliK [Pseudoxanthomonas sp. 3HH-4]|uniref:flagellar hook-length control protein FliK n=1 Tax=Pseudoxanthomonas sp. 3HH-4 TaxID=1690214 RepID=UPI00114F5048|nr:flagellar hook-length control protein FliK [Pseudoxanthomonas sp. 3HH-4]TQM12368.1 flagellar hook-length control protein FliK [Pseudoxanthomonas sp. 3HH-4]